MARLVKCSVCREKVYRHEATVCTSCERIVCHDCARECADCGDTICLQCVQRCVHCEHYFCKHCMRKCEQCGTKICYECAIECGECGQYFCSDCIWESCSECGRDLCRDCIGRCEGCDAPACSDCLYYCEVCERYLCCECYPEGYEYCRECENERNCDAIRSYNYKPSVWHCHQTAYENPLYLGIELEVEADKERQDVIDTVLSFLEEQGLNPNEHVIFKEDGSLGCGGVEIVFHPATRRYLTKRLGLRNLLKELERVATSWDNKRCGIHIHVSKRACNDKLAIKLAHLIWALYETNKQPIMKFTGRTDSQWGNYCANWTEYDFRDGYPGSRYVSINTRSTETTEFRIFRGTLRYERFLAFLQFVEASIEFCRDRSIVFFKRNFAKFNPGRVLFEWEKFLFNSRFQHLKRIWVETTTR